MAANIYIRVLKVLRDKWQVTGLTDFNQEEVGILLHNRSMAEYFQHLDNFLRHAEMGMLTRVLDPLGMRIRVNQQKG